jgi:hypothetical protein
VTSHTSYTAERFHTHDDDDDGSSSKPHIVHHYPIRTGYPPRQTRPRASTEKAVTHVDHQSIVFMRSCVRANIDSWLRARCFGLLATRAETPTKLDVHVQPRRHRRATGPRWVKLLGVCGRSPAFRLPAPRSLTLRRPCAPIPSHSCPRRCRDIRIRGRAIHGTGTGEACTRHLPPRQNRVSRGCRGRVVFVAFVFYNTGSSRPSLARVRCTAFFAPRTGAVPSL